MEYIGNKEALNYCGISKSGLKTILKKYLDDLALNVNSTIEEVAEKTDQIKKVKRSDKIYLWLYSKEFLEPFKSKKKAKLKNSLEKKLKMKLRAKINKEEEVLEPEPEPEPEQIGDEYTEPYESEPIMELPKQDNKIDDKTSELFSVLLAQIEKKDKQIDSLIERMRESNLNLNSAVRKLTAPTYEEKNNQV